MTTRLTTDQREEITRRYLNGESGNALALAFGIGSPTVYRHLRAAGVFMRRRSFYRKLDPVTRRCRICKETKSVDLFVKNNTQPRCRGYTYECKDCLYRQNRERGYNLKGNTGLTLEQYNQLLAAQDGKCAICAREPGRFRFSVDHNHETNHVRGLLCQKCNQLVAGLDNEDWFEQAILYLRRRPTGLKWGPPRLKIVA
jgi:hypothetical protein